MQSNHTNALRGLSIAVVIIAGLSILACIIGAVFIGVAGAAMADVTPDMWNYYLLGDDYYEWGYSMEDYGANMGALVVLMLVFGGIAMIWELVFSVVGLIAGIIGLRDYNNPAKLNLVFGWSLAGAITAFLSGNIATMVLLIIMCVFAHKDKQLAVTQPVMVAPVTGAPMAGAPVAAAPEPVQPVAASMVTPVAAPMQPVETVSVVTAEAVEASTPITESAEPAAEPSALVQEEALEAAEEVKTA